jgi:hypothetical protein
VANTSSRALSSPAFFRASIAVQRSRIGDRAVTAWRDPHNEKRAARRALLFKDDRQAAITPPACASRRWTTPCRGSP